MLHGRHDEKPPSPHFARFVAVAVAVAFPAVEVPVDKTLALCCAQVLDSSGLNDYNISFSLPSVPCDSAFSLIIRPVIVGVLLGNGFDPG